MQLTGLLVLILFGVAITGNDISEAVVEPIIVGYLEYVEPPLLVLVNSVSTAVLGEMESSGSGTDSVESIRRQAAVPPSRIMARIRVARLGDTIRRALGWITLPSQVTPFPFNSDESRILFRTSTIFRTIDRSSTEQHALSRAADRAERELSPTNAIKIIEVCEDGSVVPLVSFMKTVGLEDKVESSVKVAKLDVSKVFFGPVRPITTTSSLLASLSLITSYTRINASNPASLMPALAAVSSPARNGGYEFKAGTTVEFEAPSSMCFGSRGFFGIGVPPNTPLRFKVEFQD